VEPARQADFWELLMAFGRRRAGSLFPCLRMVLGALALVWILPYSARAEPTATRLATTPNPSVAGQNFTLRSTVTTSTVNTATGVVAFKNGGTQIGSGALVRFGATQIAAGGTHTCAIVAGGVKCWGSGLQGQIGAEGGDGSPTPKRVSDLGDKDPNATSLAAGSLHSCAIVVGGGVKCWGEGSDGQLGAGVTSNFDVPIPVFGLSAATAIAAGFKHTCVLVAGGGVTCWGKNTDGQVGNGSTSAIELPSEVTGVSGASALGAGGDHSCAVLNGGVKCWGLNSNGQLGNNSTSSSSVPVDVSTITTAVAVAVGGFHTCAMLTNGRVRCWGFNGNGQLGNGTTISSSVPVTVAGITTAIAIAAGRNHMCVLLSSGVVRCWGNGFAGALGNGTGEDSAVPVVVTGIPSVAAIAGGSNHTCALVGEGRAWCWGLNSNGQLGNGNENFILNATQVVGLDSAIAEASASLPEGEFQLTANYAGVTGFDASTSDVVTQAVVATPAPTLTVVSSNADPSAFRQPVTLIAAVTSIAGKPTGSVTFSIDGAQSGGAVPLDSDGFATRLVSNLSVGAHEVVANYSGSGNFAASSSPPFTQTVERGATTVSLVSAPSPSAFAEVVTITATVTATAPSTGTPTGSVVFKDGSTTIGTKSLSSGQAELTTSALTKGSHALTAIYNGSANYFGATSSTRQHQVVAADSTTTLTSSLNPSRPGQSVRFTAVVTSAGFTPTGSVTFKDGATVLATRTLVAGAASLAAPDLAIGSHSVTATYNGSGLANGSVSPALIQTVDPKVGTEFRANTFTAGAQQYPAVAVLPSRQYVVVWQSNGQDGSLEGIYGQRFSAAAAPLGGEFRVNTATTGAQTRPVIAALGDGGFIVVWQSAAQDGSGLGIYAQQFKSNGAKQGSEFRVNTRTASSQSRPAVAARNSGGFVTMWDSAGQDGSGTGIYAQLFDQAGAKLGAELQINATTAGNQLEPAVASMESGDIVAIWRSINQDGALGGIFGQRLSSVGTKKGGEFAVNTTTANDQADPTVSAVGSGFWASWTSRNQDGSGLGVYAQRFSAAGARVGTEFRVNTTVANNQWQPAIAPIADSGAIIVWTSRLQDGSGNGVYAKRYSAAGAVLDAEFRFNTTTLKDQWQPAIAVQSATAFLGVWVSRDQDGSLEGVYGQRFQVAP